jgi:hypothetical protein
MTNPVDEALQRVRKHLRNSTLEGAQAISALIEATMHASDLKSVAADSMIGQIQQQLEDWITVLEGGSSFSMPRALTEPLVAAVDAEIKRWERRSQTDPDARLVLRAFLRMRELLWEIGMRSPEQKTPSSSMHEAPAPKDVGSTRDRVQRFKLED